jgi:hypothetical protein
MRQKNILRNFCPVQGMHVEESTENSYPIRLKKTFYETKNVLRNFCAVQGVQALLQGAAEGALPLHLQGVPPDLSVDQE